MRRLTAEDYAVDAVTMAKALVGTLVFSARLSA